MPKFVIVICSVFAAIGVLILLVASVITALQVRFVQSAGKSSGVVKEYRLSSTPRSRSIISYPVVVFMTSTGEQIEFVSTVGSNLPAYQPGDSVAVLYPLDHPDRAVIDSFWQLWFVSLQLFLMGSVFSLVGFGMLIFVFLKRRRDKRLRLMGTLVQATFDRVELDETVAMNGSSPYLIIAQWINPADGLFYEFRSDSLWDNPESSLQSKALIPVYIDLENPKKYVMDLSFMPTAT